MLYVQTFVYIYTRTRALDITSFIFLSLSSPKFSSSLVSSSSSSSFSSSSSSSSRWFRRGGFVRWKDGRGERALENSITGRGEKKDDSRDCVAERRAKGSRADRGGQEGKIFARRPASRVARGRLMEAVEVERSRGARLPGSGGGGGGGAGGGGGGDGVGASLATVHSDGHSIPFLLQTSRPISFLKDCRPVRESFQAFSEFRQGGLFAILSGVSNFRIRVDRALVPIANRVQTSPPFFCFPRTREIFR